MRWWQQWQELNRVPRSAEIWLPAALVPWAALKYDTNLGGYRTGITEGQLRDAPDFSDSWEDRDWETRTHEHYGVPGYWGT